MKILVTGAAGFIGFHLSKNLAVRGDQIIGVDNLNKYYDVQLKHDRLDQLKSFKNFEFQQIDIVDENKVKILFENNQFDRVVHLAAQAGVRYSIENPMAYVQSNIVGFMHLIEACRHHKIAHLVYASSSSVYGANTKLPFSIHDNVDHPLSLYAASKKSNELIAHTYSHLYSLPTTGLRFFTVYGPWGRPDMALFLFTKAILQEKPIHVFNYGKMKRDFTYVDDIVEGVTRVMDKGAKPTPNWSSLSPDPGNSKAPFRIYNIGNHQSVELMYFIEMIEKALGKKAIKELMALQDGDVPETFADVDDLVQDIDFQPNTKIEDGIEKSVAWYQSYYS